MATCSAGVTAEVAKFSQASAIEPQTDAVSGPLAGRVD